MHWLTKFFVVVAAVLSVALSALTVTYSVNADRISSELSKAQQAEQQATTAQQIQAQSHAAEVASLRGELSSREEQLASLRTDMRQLEQAKVALEAEIREAEAARKSVESQVTQGQVSVQTLTDLVSSYRDEANTLRTAASEARNQRLELEDRLADLESENDVLEQNTRALRERLAEAQRTTSGGVASGGGTTTASSRLAGPTVFGSVEGVSFEASTGRTLVQVNLGQNDGLSDNNELYVVRGSNYVGTIVLTRVDLQASVGYVRLTSGGLSVERGDEVRSRILARN